MKFLRSGWFVALLFLPLLAHSVANRLVWWTVFYLAFAAILGVIELVCKRWTGYALSEQFGQFYARKPTRGRWFFGVLVIVIVGLIVHLWAWR